ncbi:oxygen-dependent coproporphyrinogen oxidase [Hymenobacter sp. BT770]|uniref:oxygen-dependent coproporphyrinogen oxidase n=1 Tax=Hymenobacter sp. BT770 TaxID=2886942 RepID=UPI001D11B10C|nr:oxygen-dependent coproporphyrinogen oxidase [Hymenobacter sp. BT770]MCC3155335.1 oxygen-dependent coproporphyrinogen oxidase [Hymenobacter sp. BT770]MDO3417368.1 oxygen-dependent coproporphyrinogen oxidase [Hymenobacter sp. BT770]
MQIDSATATISPARTTVAASMRRFQDWLCQQLETADGSATFTEDAWAHEGGGGGRTRVIANGAVLEKGGVNFSAVWGRMSEAAARQLLMPDPSYFATGVSVVQHPRSPMVPISHMNIRYFEAGNGEAWFGGGLDLTPIYVDEAQARWFHEQIRAVCDDHNPAYYARFKAWADEYFYLPHRQETRGVGGIFFDRLTVGKDGDFDELLPFVQAVGEVYGRTYTALMQENRDRPYAAREKQWQQVRRGRYAEFNLAIDRGTRFGLETGGRTESILMSLPPQAEWHYNLVPEAGSPEAATQAWLRKDVAWAV